MNKVTWTHTSSSPPLQHPLWSGSRNRSTEEHVKVMQDMWMEKENKRKKEGYSRQERRRTEGDRVFEINSLPSSLRAKQREEPHSATSVQAFPPGGAEISLESLGRVSPPQETWPQQTAAGDRQAISLPLGLGRRPNRKVSPEVPPCASGLKT